MGRAATVFGYLVEHAEAGSRGFSR
jgi:hypothetical protein